MQRNQRWTLHDTAFEADHQSVSSNNFYLLYTFVDSLLSINESILNNFLPVMVEYLY